MNESWPPVNYEDWSPTCDTLHAHSQVLGKLAVRLAPPEPQFQHVALRLTARGFETAMLPAPDGHGALVAGLDLRSHQAFVESTAGSGQRIQLTPNRSVAAVTRDLLQAVRASAGPVEIDPTPQEVSWTVPLDEDEEHSTYDTGAAGRYFAAATQAALVLGEFRAPYRGRSTPVNAWWGSFDLAVNVMSGRAADPPGDDYITRNAMDVEEVAVGWWPGDHRYGKAAFFAYAFPAPENYGAAELSPAPTRWNQSLGLYILDWDDVRASPEPHGAGLEFARSVFVHSCTVCNWDPALVGSTQGTPPPIR